MKKYKYYIIVAILLMSIPIIYKATIKDRKTNYKRNNYSISEHFYIEEKKHYYDYIIKKDNIEYSYTLDYNNHKKNKLIKEIKEYTSGNIKCIIPIYKTKIKNEIYCLENNNQVSKYYLKDNDIFQKILNKIEKENIVKLNNSNSLNTYKNINIYKKNIPDNYKLIIWTYKGIVIIDNKNNKYQKFFNDDLYENVMATTTKNYFVLFDNTNVNGIKEIHYYDLKKDKYDKFKLTIKLDKNSYINGTIEDTIYVTDRKRKKQYTISIKKKEIEEIGNEDLLYTKYELGTKKLLSKADFFKENQYFKEEITSSKSIKKERNYYYYYEDDIFYKNRTDSKRCLLFELSNPTEWNVYDGELLVLKDDTLYLYSDQTGLRRLVEYNELKYNYKNIYYLWKL